MAAPHRHSIRHGQGPNLPVLQVLQVLQAGSVSDPRSAVTARAAPCRPAGRGPLRLPCLDAVPDGVSAVLCPERGTPNPTARRRTRRVPRPPSGPCRVHLLLLFQTNHIMVAHPQQPCVSATYPTTALSHLSARHTAGGGSWRELPPHPQRQSLCPSYRHRLTRHEFLVAWS